MVVPGKNCLQVLVVFWFLDVSSSFLDIEELKGINYGISILNTPVLMAQDLTGGVMYLSSKYGQQYQCQFPNNDENEKRENKQEQEAKEVGISELLKPMESEPCLLKTKDWWTYEFCFGKYIRQYHMEDGKPVGDIMVLGNYASEYNWDESDGEEGKKSRNQLNRYHSQNYVNGSECELTGKQRKSEVRFMCETGSGDSISRIDEPETCSYIITIHTMKICHHPFLKPRLSRKPLPITCNPVLGQNDYQQYIDQQEIIRKEKERQENEKSLLKAELNKLQKDITKLRKPTGPDDVEDKAASDDLPAAAAQLQDALKQTLKDMLSGFTEDEIEDLADKADLKVNIVDDMAKINNLIDDMRNSDSKITVEESTTEDRTTNPTKGETNTNPAQGEAITNPAQGETNANEQTGGIIQGEETVDELKDESNLKYSDDGIHGDSVAKVTVSSGDIVMEETNPDMPLSEKKGGEEEEDEYLQDFSRELDEITRSKHIKKKLHNIREEIANGVRDQFDEIFEEAQEELEDEGFEVDDVKKSEAFKQMSSTLNKMMKKLENTEKEIDNMDKEIENAANTKAKSSLLGDNRIKVRVLKMSKDGKDEVDKEETEGQKKFASAIKKELEKSGLNTEGRNVQVKIVTTGFYDAEDDSIQILSDEETKTFSKLMLGMLGGNNEALREAERQQELENAYQFSWKSEDSKKKKAE